jgi:hypothetical protein
LKKATLFRLVVDQIQRIEERFHSGIGAPQGHQQTDDESDTKRRLSLRCHAGDLVPYHLDGSAGHHSGDAVEMRRNGGGIGEQSVERNQRGDCRKYGQDRVKGHPGGDDDDAILTDVLPDAEEDILPAARRHFGRGRGRPRRGRAGL